MINAIKSVLASTTDQLVDLEYVESLIKEFGLYHDPREIYGEPYNDWTNPNYMFWNKGMYQQPRQIAQAMIYLHDKEIKSYLEIGAFYGYTFAFVTAYLSKFGLQAAIALDSNKYMSKEQFDEIRDTIQIGMQYQFRQGKIEISGHPSITGILKRHPFDLVFIDGNHAYSAVKEDYENVGKYAKICMFHDIYDMYIEDECEGGGPVQFWKEIKWEKFSKSKSGVMHSPGYPDSKYAGGSKYKGDFGDIIEFRYHPENKRVMGIGVIQPGGHND